MDKPGVLNKILWIKGLWNSFLALMIGFVLYMLPGLIIGFKMGFELGPKIKDSSEVSTQISETISKMYSENHWLTIGYILVTGLLIFWRSAKVSRGTGDKKYINGLIVGFFPVLIALLYIFMMQLNWLSLVVIIVSLGSGLLGSIIPHESEKSTS